MFNRNRPDTITDMHKFIDLTADFCREMQRRQRGHLRRELAEWAIAITLAVSILTIISLAAFGAAELFRNLP